MLQASIRATTRGSSNVQVKSFGKQCAVVVCLSLKQDGEKNSGPVVGLSSCCSTKGRCAMFRLQLEKRFPADDVIAHSD